MGRGTRETTRSEGWDFRPYSRASGKRGGTVSPEPSANPDPRGRMSFRLATRGRCPEGAAPRQGVGALCPAPHSPALRAPPTGVSTLYPSELPERPANSSLCTLRATLTGYHTQGGRHPGFAARGVRTRGSTWPWGRQRGAFWPPRQTAWGLQRGVLWAKLIRAELGRELGREPGRGPRAALRGWPRVTPGKRLCCWQGASGSPAFPAIPWPRRASGFALLGAHAPSGLLSGAHSG